MRNLLFHISYCGAAYHGWQVQKNAITVQQRVQDAIEKVLQRRESISGCSRTDSGVHANQYCFHMHTRTTLPTQQLQRGINHFLPPDIAICKVKEVPLSFHARYSCLGKEYVYLLWNAPSHHPFYHRRALHYPYPLSIEPIKKVLPKLLGERDFRSFCADNNQTNTVRHLRRADLQQEGQMIRFSFEGNGFLYHMVRIMVGTLLFVSEGKIAPQELPAILEARDRNRAGKTAPAEGLYLNQVFYPHQSTQNNPQLRRTV